MKRLIPFFCACLIVAALSVFPIIESVASSDGSFTTHCNTCAVGIEFYTQRIDKQVFDLSARLKSLSERHGSKRVKYAFFLIRSKDVLPYDARFYQNAQWPNGLEVAIGNEKQAKDRGVETYPSAFIRFGSNTAVVPGDRLNETIDSLDVLMKQE